MQWSLFTLAEQDLQINPELLQACRMSIIGTNYCNAVDIISHSVTWYNTQHGQKNCSFLVFTDIIGMFLL